MKPSKWNGSILYCAYDYISMFGLKVVHISKRGTTHVALGLAYLFAPLICIRAWLAFGSWLWAGWRFGILENFIDPSCLCYRCVWIYFIWGTIFYIIYKSVYVPYLEYIDFLKCQSPYVLCKHLNDIDRYIICCLIHINQSWRQSPYLDKCTKTATIHATFSSHLMPSAVQIKVRITSLPFG